MRITRPLLAATGAAALLFGLGTVTASPAVADPCGFYKTHSDAYYNHCTSDGSRVVIEVEVFGPNYEKCVGPGLTWLGSASRIDGAWYVGRTC
ncbi:DUF6355 family natural product biosynthesis protein [Streptomyces sp. 12297]|uniref:DUF6355 family natural product biosynthesis protein n=1 Tax=Streptomyces sp. NBC_00239 TaxID=2903640 RepID=UPI002E2B7E1C|nr:DUF6355 family natural product biosynthesis protein [Streptomyces sp. NBC_00239]